MIRKKAGAKAERKRFSTEFKQQALLRAVKDGIPPVARDLGLEPAQLYAWRTKAQQQGDWQQDSDRRHFGAFSLSALPTTRMDDSDMATAAISGVARPAIAMGTARIL